MKPKNHIIVSLLIVAGISLLLIASIWTEPVSEGLQDSNDTEHGEANREYNTTVPGLNSLYQKPENEIYILHKPNVSAFVQEPVPIGVRTNRYGLREAPLKPEKPPNTTRILVIGDSNTFGWYINQTDRYTNILERRMNRISHSQTFNVINAAVGGWGLKDYYTFLNTVGNSLNPDLIIIGIVGNDDLSRQKHDQLRHQAMQHVNSTGRTDPDSINAKYAELKQAWEQNKTIGDSGFQYISDIAAKARKNETPIIFAKLTKLPRPIDQDLSFSTNKTDIYSVKAFRWYQKGMRAKEGSHPSEKGHQFIAEKLYDFITDQNILPNFQQPDSDHYNVSTLLSNISAS